MNRTGIPTLMGFQEGGDVDTDQTNTDTSGIISAMLDPQDVTQNFALYSSLLNQLAPEPRRLTGYDLASELGKGLLAQQSEKFPSLGRGIGLGFQSFKSLQDEKPFNDLEDFLNFHMLTIDEFNKVVERFRNKEIWSYKSGEWKLNTPLT